MKIAEFSKQNKFEFTGFILVYLILFINAYLTHDSLIALISAFCGITYTILAGKGIPVCYPIGATGSALYAYLSFVSNLWGNMILYLFYYIPMQIIGFFKWNKNLKSDKYEIIKIKLSNKERFIYGLIAIILSVVVIFILNHYGDKNPIIDGITTVLSILAMYLTVRRCLEQWVVWFIVNLLSFIMWLEIALNGIKVWSTVIMWFVYTILAVYFFIKWNTEIKSQKSAQ